MKKLTQIVDKILIIVKNNWQRFLVYSVFTLISQVNFFVHLTSSVTQSNLSKISRERKKCKLALNKLF